MDQLSEELADCNKAFGREFKFSFITLSLLKLVCELDNYGPMKICLQLSQGFEKPQHLAAALWDMTTGSILVHTYGNCVSFGTWVANINFRGGLSIL